MQKTVDLLEVYDETRHNLERITTITQVLNEYLLEWSGLKGHALNWEVSRSIELFFPLISIMYESLENCHTEIKKLLKEVD